MPDNPTPTDPAPTPAGPADPVPAPPARPKRKRPPVLPIQRMTPRGSADAPAGLVAAGQHSGTATDPANSEAAAAVSETVLATRTGSAVAPTPLAQTTSAPAAGSTTVAVAEPGGDPVATARTADTGSVAPRQANSPAAAHGGNGNVSQDLFGLAPYPRAPLPPRVPPRSMRVPLPRGALLATALTGIAAAVFIPLDRPGIGWLLAGSATAGAVYTVDRMARRATPTDATADGSPAEATPDSLPTATTPSGSPVAVASAGSPAVAGVASTSSENSSGNPGTGGAGRAPRTRGVAQGAGAGGGSTAADHEISETPGAQSAADEQSGEGPQGLSARPNAQAEHGEEAAAGERSARGAGIGAGVAASAARNCGDPGSLGALRRWAPLWWSAIAMGLLGVGAVRAAEWLFVLCLLGAAVAGSLAVVRRSVYGLVFDMLAVPVSAVMSVPWLYRGVQRVRGRRVSSVQRVGWSVVATLGVLVVFVPLLAGADAVFARLVESVMPEFEVDSVVRWVFVGIVAGLGAAGALYLLAGPPPAAGESDSVAGRLVRKRWSRIEWGLPMGALTLVFAVFVGTQLAVLFGGAEYVRRNADLTVAEYARSGFWQLSVVSMLTLAVIAVVQTWAAQQEARDRLWLRVAVAAVSVLTLVIVASALHRMWLYQQSFGFTVLRLLVEVFEVWIGVVYLLVLASLVRLRRHWVPRAAIGAGAATLLVLAVVNPELLIADRNIDRWLAGTTVAVDPGEEQYTGSRETKQDLDIDYLRGLSTDVLPATDRLPEPQRSAIENAIRHGLEDDTWQGWNRSRSAAR
ncbi:DUF4153 domain-containing protein [Nocardia sp. NPDC127526]|uniref:DUF4153 domain-containing protein n=1 Tax=Nocardia sp. NPDC127526 TaxID=3345393 RepID=UPI00362EC5FD